MRSGGQTRTGGLWVMSPASETISSTPLCCSSNGNRTHLVKSLTLINYSLLRTLSLYGQPSRLPTRSCQERPALAIEPYLILMKDSNLRLPAQRDPTYHLSNEKTVTHFHRQITNAYQTPYITSDPVAARSFSYPEFCSPYENRTRVSRLKT